MPGSATPGRAVEGLAEVSRIVTLIAAAMTGFGVTVFIVLSAVLGDGPPSSWSPGGLAYNVFCLAGFASIVCSVVAWIVRSPRLIIAFALPSVVRATYGTLEALS